MIDARRRLDAFLHRPRRTRRLPLWPPHHGSTTASAASRRRTQRMCAMEATARELLATAQDDRKAKLDAGRVDTVFMVGDSVQLRPTSCSTPQTLAPVVGRSFHGARLPSLPQPGSQEPSPPLTRRRRRRCRPPQQRRSSPPPPPPPRNRRSAAARRRHAPPDAPSLVVTPASFRLPTCRDDLGPCISGPDGVVLLAWRWLDSRDGGPTYLDPGVLACSPSPVRPSVSAGRRDARLAPPCRLARAGWPLGLFFARRDSRTVALAERPPRLFPTCLVMRDK